MWPRYLSGYEFSEYDLEALRYTCVVQVLLQGQHFFVIIELLFLGGNSIKFSHLNGQETKTYYYKTRENLIPFG